MQNVWSQCCATTLPGILWTGVWRGRVQELQAQESSCTSQRICSHEQRSQHSGRPGKMLPFTRDIFHQFLCCFNSFTELSLVEIIQPHSPHHPGLKGGCLCRLSEQLKISQPLKSTVWTNTNNFRRGTSITIENHSNSAKEEIGNWLNMSISEEEVFLWQPTLRTNIWESIRSSVFRGRNPTWIEQV